MKIQLVCLVIASALVGCGGGAPYVGLWQCGTDPDASLEVKQYEDYFIIVATGNGKQIRRDGRFENEEFSVGANNVGRPMTFELSEGQLTCSHPPNFCQCKDAYDKVSSLSSSNKLPEPKIAKPAETQTQLAATPSIAKQVIRDREPLTLNLVNGGAVRLFDDVNNEDNERRMFDWGKLAYYYLPNLVLSKLPNDQFADAREIDNKVFVFLQLAVRKIDKFELMEGIDESINTKIIPELVLPLDYGQLTVEIPGASTSSVVVSSAGFESKAAVIEIALPVLAASDSDLAEKLKAGQDIADSINNRSLLPLVSIEFTQGVRGENLGEVQHEQVAWQWNIEN